MALDNYPIHISTLFSTVPLKTVKSRRTERGDLISYFTERINSDRKDTKYKQLSISSMAHLLSIYRADELYVLRIKCDKAKSFSKIFWWYCNNLKDKTKSS